MKGFFLYFLLALGNISVRKEKGTIMKVTMYGTAGTEPVCRPDRLEHGGNTTCVRIESDCIPPDFMVGIDSGTGLREFARAFYAEGKVTANILYTHTHSDHTQGLPASRLTHDKTKTVELMGPVDHDHGIKDEFQNLMALPRFPVDSAEVQSHFRFHKLLHPAGMVLLFHPEGGKALLGLHEFEAHEKNGTFIPIRQGKKYPLSQCLVIRMYRTTHPEQTISYRFEERPTGKVFVFLTDHECTYGIPSALKRHITGADLLIADAQYTEAKYHAFTAGFGHGTGKYVAGLAETCGVQRVGLTHHDPESSDADIYGIVQEARDACKNPNTEIFSCKDGMVVEL